MKRIKVVVVQVEERPLPDCPMCGGEGQLLGQLGQLIHFRCRQCGYDFNCRYTVEGGPR